MSRETRTDFQESFRVVVTAPWGVRYHGPYQTRGAARSKRTTIVNHEARYPNSGGPSTVTIQRLSGPWEDVVE